MLIVPAKEQEAKSYTEGISAQAKGVTKLQARIVELEAEIERLRGLTGEYADCLMGMVCQHCQADEPDTYMDMALSANEDALALLETNGLAEQLPGHLWRWRLLWDKLDHD